MLLAGPALNKCSTQAGRLLEEARKLMRTADSSRLVHAAQLQPLKQNLNGIEADLWKALVELLCPLAPRAGLLRDTFPHLSLGIGPHAARRSPSMLPR